MPRKSGAGRGSPERGTTPSAVAATPGTGVIVQQRAFARPKSCKKCGRTDHCRSNNKKCPFYKGPTTQKSDANHAAGAAAHISSFQAAAEDDDEPPQKWTEDDYKKKKDWDTRQCRFLAGTLQAWMDNHNFPPLNNTEREEFAESYNAGIYDELLKLPRKDQHKKRAEFRSAGALKKKIDTIYKSRKDKKTGVSRVPPHIATIAGIMRQSALDAHVISVENLQAAQAAPAAQAYGYSDAAFETPLGTGNEGPDDDDEEDGFSDDDDDDNDDIAARERELKLELARIKERKKKMNAQKKRRMSESPGASSVHGSPKRRRSSSSGSIPSETPTGNDALLEMFTKQFSPQARTSKAAKTDALHSLVQVFTMKIMRDMMKN